jgi:hypothetical protein
MNNDNISLAVVLFKIDTLSSKKEIEENETQIIDHMF